MYGMINDEAITYSKDHRGLDIVSIKMLNKHLESVHDTIQWAIDYQSHHFAFGERNQAILVLHYPYQQEFDICVDYSTDCIILTPLY